ncbi:MAG: histidine kinase [Aquihabitans sp.]
MVRRAGFRRSGGVRSAASGGRQGRSGGDEAHRHGRARDDERRRLARDIHDIVSHSLAVTMLHISAARVSIGREPGKAHEALSEAERRGRAGMDDVRRMVEVLRSGDPAAMRSGPGMGELHVLVESFRSAGVEIEATVNLGSPGLPVESGNTAYRLVQESLANAVKHGCGPIDLLVTVEDGHLVIRVENEADGDQIDSPDGYGLLGMRERTVVLGGTLLVRFTDDRWILEAKVPMPVTPSANNERWK